MKKLILILTLFASITFVYAQDIAFVNPYSTPIYLNPAFAGYEGCSRIASTFQNQWPSIGTLTARSMSSYDQYVKQLHGSFAVRYMFDTQEYTGSKMNTAYFTYSPNIRLFDKKLFISPAIEIGWRRNKTNWDFYYPSFQDPRLYPLFGPEVIKRPDKDVLNVLDINSGVLISHKNFVYGVALHHINKPDIIFPIGWQLKRKLTAHFSYLFEINENYKLSPSILFTNQDGIQQYNSSLAFLYSNLRIAAGYGMNPDLHNDILYLNLGYQKKWLRIIYGYELLISRLKNHRTLGTHEIGFIATFNCKNKKENRKGVELINF